MNGFPHLTLASSFSFVVLAALVASVGCGEADPIADPSADAAPAADAAAAGDASQVERPADAAAAADAAVDRSDAADGGACHDLVGLGAPVPPTWQVGAVPPPAGGTIVDGTYVLVGVTRYRDDAPPADAGAPPAGETWAVTARVRGTTLETVEERDGRPAAHPTFRLTAAGTSLGLDETCPETKTGARLGYTATPTSLELVNAKDGLVFRLTKR